MIQDELADASALRCATPVAQREGAAVCRLQDCSLIAEADHRIANHLAILARQVRLKAAALARQPDVPPRAAVGVLLGVEAEIAAVARLHRQLSGRAARPSADLAQELHEACTPFRCGLSGDVLLIEAFEGGCAVSADKILPLIRIVIEVITNALKYAYRDGGGYITARLRKETAATAVVEIADHGPSFPAAFDPATDGGLGFQVVRALARQLGATATFASSSEGVRFKLSLPLERTAPVKPMTLVRSVRG